MFDMGFTEMMLIGIVALIVIGPERLPGVARTAGKYLGRLKRFMTSVKADVEQELRADELREILAQQQRELNTLKDSISDAGKEIEKETGAVGAALAEDLDQSSHTAGQGAAAAESEKPASADTVEPAEQDQPEKAKT
ncbi:MAG: Sec-independent protein translocase protein TatB [Gammaproteobacteria bacterium]|nr:Sec-independent protein translocase protein TatB [Gammaproteobacteria bacterium]